ncbi:hypothetical protein Tco_1522763 [Tanacetum coccineum]
MECVGYSCYIDNIHSLGFGSKRPDQMRQSKAMKTQCYPRIFEIKNVIQRTSGCYIDMRFPRKLFPNRSKSGPRDRDDSNTGELKRLFWGVGTDKSGPWGGDVIQAAAKLGYLVIKCPFSYLRTEWEATRSDIGEGTGAAAHGEGSGVVLLNLDLGISSQLAIGGLPSEEWEKCKFSKTVKGKTVYALVLNAAFWAGVTTCLKVFAPLVKVLRMVDADWKPSMGFIYHVEANDSIVEILGILFPGDYELQDLINTVELPMYKKLQKLTRHWLLKSVRCNNDKFDPANANLMEHNKKRMARNHEILLGEDASEAQEWIVDGDDAHWEAIGDALGVEDE